MLHSKTINILFVSLCFIVCINCNSSSDSNINTSKLTTDSIHEIKDKEYRLFFKDYTLYISGQDIDSTITLEDAISIYDSINGWRIPTTDELIFIFRNKIDGFENTWYWSNSGEKDVLGIAIHYKDGKKERISSNSHLKLRLVRSGNIINTRDKKSLSNDKYSDVIFTNETKQALRKVINRLPLIEMPFNDSLFQLYKEDILIDTVLLDNESRSKIFTDIFYNGNSEVKAQCLIPFSLKSYSIIITAYFKPGNERWMNYLLTLDSNLNLTGIEDLGGKPVSDCICEKHNFTYGKYYKIISDTRCPAEDGTISENQTVSVEKHMFNNGKISHIQRYLTSYSNFLYYSSHFYLQQDNSLQCKIKKTLSYTNVYNEMFVTSNITGIILSNESFTCWKTSSNSWSFVETKSGLEGYVINEDLERLK